MVSPSSNLSRCRIDISKPGFQACHKNWFDQLMELSVSQSWLGKYLPRSQQALGEARFLGRCCRLLVTARGLSQALDGVHEPAGRWPQYLRQSLLLICPSLPFPKAQATPHMFLMLVPQFPNRGGGCLLCTPRTAAEHPTPPPKHHGLCPFSLRCSECRARVLNLSASLTSTWGLCRVAVP